MAESVRRRPFTIRVTSQEGGEGKTVIAVNLAIALADLGYKVLLVDANPFQGGVAVCLGLGKVKVDFRDILSKGLNVKKNVLHYTKGKIDVIAQNPSTSGYNPTLAQVSAMFEQELRLGYDFLIADSASGFFPGGILRYYTEMIDVALPYEDSIFAEGKLIERHDYLGIQHSVVLNRVGSGSRAELIRSKAERLLGEKVRFFMPYDELVEKSINQSTPLYLMNKRSKFSLAILKLARAYARAYGPRKRQTR